MQFFHLLHVRFAKMDQEKSITPQQEAVILALLEGKTQKEAAEAAGVAPETVSRWMKRDAVFVATLNARRKDLWNAHREKLRAQVREAVTVMGDLLKSENERVRLQAATAILRTASDLAPGGETEPEKVRKAWEEAELWDAIISPRAFQ